MIWGAARSLQLISSDSSDLYKRQALGGVLHHRDAAYTGMIGSRRKIAAIREKLLAQGITPAQLAAVHAPIGLSLGGETPEEIAVSILAELLMTRYGKTKADL